MTTVQPFDSSQHFTCTVESSGKVHRFDGTTHEGSAICVASTESSQRPDFTDFVTISSDWGGPVRRFAIAAVGRNVSAAEVDVGA